jgi:hypothetical protein
VLGAVLVKISFRREYALREPAKAARFDVLLGLPIAATSSEICSGLPALRMASRALYTLLPGRIFETEMAGRLLGSATSRGSIFSVSSSAWMYTVAFLICVSRVAISARFFSILLRMSSRSAPEGLSLVANRSAMEKIIAWSESWRKRAYGGTTMAQPVCMLHFWRWRYTGE